jgi:shikimate kinase
MLLFLIGFMGSGKSYTGKRLSAMATLPFYDLDLLVEAHEKKSIPEIFSESGEDYFRTLEARVLRQCASFEHGIIACGGGTPCYFDNMAWMNTYGTTVWLNPSLALLYQRLIRKPEKRPLLAGLQSEEAWKVFLSEKMNSRRPFYQEAQYCFSQDLGTEDIAAAIYKLIFEEKA